MKTVLRHHKVNVRVLHVLIHLLYVYYQSYVLYLDGNNNNENKGQKVILLEDPRPELLAALSINGGSFLKNDLLPKIVLGKEDSKLVFKGRLSLFQVIPEVKDILDQLEQV